MPDSVGEAVESEDHADAEEPGHLISGILGFQQDCIEELLKYDGLCVIGQGLGLPTVVAALLAVHHQTKDSGGAVVMVGAGSHCQELAENGCHRR